VGAERLSETMSREIEEFNDMKDRMADERVAVERNIAEKRIRMESEAATSKEKKLLQLLKAQDEEVAYKKKTSQNLHEILKHKLMPASNLIWLTGR